MKYVINGGNKLYGQVNIQSAKNSVLCLIAASILSSGSVYIRKCPKIDDVTCMIKILKTMGAKVEFLSGGLYLDTSSIKTTVVPGKLAEKLRASFFLVGTLLARYKSAFFTHAGGCEIGQRPLDIHIDAFEKLGVKMVEEGGVMHFSTSKLKGANIRFKYPSVGATENAIMAACFAEGTTFLENCACEPEICDLQNFINQMGGRVSGAGTPFVRIEGVKRLFGTDFTPTPDRIETGTFMLAVACCGGELEIRGTKPKNISVLTEKLTNNACKIWSNNDIIYINKVNNLVGMGEIITSPHPGFPTDLQPLVVACASICNGKTLVKETVFESRFKYVNELKKMNANITVRSDTLEIVGSKLYGARVFAPDLRGGASLCIAGLCAVGKTVVENVCYIERGYENFHKKLSLIGADIVKK